MQCYQTGFVTFQVFLKFYNLTFDIGQSCLDCTSNFKTFDERFNAMLYVMLFFHLPIFVTSNKIFDNCCTKLNNFSKRVVQ